MKILQISSARVQYKGGTEKIVFDLSKELVKKGHSVSILQTNLYEEGSIFEEHKIIEGVEIITCKNKFFARGFGYSLEFRKKLKNIFKNYDLIHVHGYGRYTSFASINFLRDKKPIIFTAHGFFHSKKDGVIKKVHDCLFSKILKNVTFCTALTELEREKYLSLGVKKSKIKIIPNWVDLSLFKKSKINKSSFLKSKLINPKRKTLLYVGRIHPSKGINLVLNAIRGLDINFVIVGRDSDYKKDILKLVNEYNLQKNVIILNSIDDKELLKIYSVSDALVLFSEWEGFGIVLLEAMALGLPLIVSDRGALPLVVENGKEGIVVPFPKTNLLGDEIKRILSDDKIMDEMGKLGEQKAKLYGVEKIIEKYELAYSETIFER